MRYMRKMDIPAKSHLRSGREISRATNDVIIVRLHSTGLLATLKCNQSTRSKQEKSATGGLLVAALWTLVKLMTTPTVTSTPLMQ